MTCAFSRLQLDEMLRLHASGLSLNAIGDRFGVSGPTIRKNLYPTEGDFRRVNFDLDTAKALFESGLSSVSISGRLGCSAQTVRKYLKEAGICVSRGYTKARPDAGTSGAAIHTAPSYREHAHRSMMQPMEVSEPVLEIDLAFWPTRRGTAKETLPQAILNCQRCGDAIPPTAGWWCSECDKVIWYLQQRKLLSMVQIAHNGEYDPPWGEWIQDVAPWLISLRVESIAADKRALTLEEKRGPKADTLHERAEAFKAAKAERKRSFERMRHNYYATARLRGGIA